jgi:hypothetical protein
VLIVVGHDHQAAAVLSEVLPSQLYPRNCLRADSRTGRSPQLPDCLATNASARTGDQDGSAVEVRQADTFAFLLMRPRQMSALGGSDTRIVRKRRRVSPVTPGGSSGLTPVT